MTGCLLVISGCTGGAVQRAVHQDVAVRSNSVRLTSFRGCGDELASLRRAAEASVGPYGLPGLASSVNGTAYPAVAAGAAPAAAGASAAAAAPSTPAYSGTNDYVAGVDEPDLVKTDGRRIVTLTDGVLEVIDAASRTVTGRLDLRAVGGDMAYPPANLLLSGDHALVLISGGALVEGVAGSDGSPLPGYGSRLLLVDLAGGPSVISSYSIEGSLIDARQIGSTVRVVISSQLRLNFPAQPESTPGAQRVAANQAVIRHAGLDAWLPEYAETSGGATITGHVACSAVSRPAAYSGANLITVLTFDLTSDALGSGDGMSIIADGTTVYGTDSSLYVVSDERWLAEAATAGAGPAVSPGLPASPSGSAAGQQTDIYRFDITSPGPPSFAAGGSVPGYLVDQYALSEWQGYLRIATTTGTSWALADGEPADAQTSSSAVYVLSTRGPVMRLVGEVTGLGLTERIYSVRFIGPAGYVVTFRQTDPLYTVDLSDPTQPRVRGSVALTGYSAYLHPVSDARLIGIGRQADAMGHVGGTQVSLFDVSDLASPTLLATFTLAAATSDAEFDPHAFLYWPGDDLMVVPLQRTGMVTGAPVPTDGVAQSPDGPLSGDLVLRIDDSGITETGFITQPEGANATAYAGYSPIERSLIIGQTLWTISAAGAMATDLTTLRLQGWIPFATASPN